MTTFSVIVPIAPDRSPVVLASLRALDAADAPHEVLTQIGPNPSRNRNQSIARGRGDVLAFTDDDCVVAPDWLARAAAFFREHPEYDAVGGPQLTADVEEPIGRAAGHALASWFGAHRGWRRFRRAPFALASCEHELSSANLFVTRRAFERWGPFDERLWPNEETALLRRIESGGGRIAYDPSIVVFHKRRGSLGALARQCFGYGRGRARQSFIEGVSRPGVAQAVPALFLLYLVLLPLLVAWSPAAMLPLAVYGTIAMTLAVATAIRHADVAAVAMPLAFLAIHSGYAAGFVLETVSLRVAAGDGMPAVEPQAVVEAVPR